MMLDLTEAQKLAQNALRQWCSTQLEPRVAVLESGQELPYPLIQSLGQTFGLPELAAAACDKAIASEGHRTERKGGFGAIDTGMIAVLMWELSRVCPGFAMAFGASIGLFGGAVMAQGTAEQVNRWARPVLMLQKVGAWGLTEPGAGSDAFGSMSTRAELQGHHWVLNGCKTFITNAPYADYFLIYAKLHGDTPNQVGAFILERGMEGLSTGPVMQKMGMHTSPTGEVFLDEVRVGADRLLGGEAHVSQRQAAKSSLSSERFGMTPMCLGIVDRCLEESVRYAKTRVQWGKPIAEFQLIQAKLAEMYLTRSIMFALLLRQLEADQSRVPLNAIEASVAKLYSARAATAVALEAVQIMGGTGYMRGSVVEMLARDAKLLQIGGGTDEIQTLRIAREVIA